MTDRQNKLFVDLSGTAGPLSPEAMPASIDGYILSCDTPPEGLDIAGKEIMIAGGVPQSEPDIAVLAQTRICDYGLEATARLRQQYPELTWIPRVDVTLQPTAYHFPTTHYSETFRTYQPIFTGPSPYQVEDGDAQLVAWLQKAAELGFSTLWLNAPGAAQAENGLDLDLRELALGNWSGDLWLSGGASTLMHVKYLVQEGGIDALVVAPALAVALGCDQIRASLRRGMERPPSEAPDTAEPHATDLPRTG